MNTQNTTIASTGSELKKTISEREGDERLHQEVESLIDQYLKESTSVNKIPCSTLILDVFGSDAHMASDEVFYMHHTILDLLTLIADPEVWNKLDEIKKSSFSNKHAMHLKRLALMMHCANNKYAYAEMVKAELEIGVQPVERLEGWKAEYSYLLEEERAK